MSRYRFPERSCRQTRWWNRENVKPRFLNIQDVVTSLPSWLPSIRISTTGSRM